ncbi:HNH endonuclease [Streptomyces albidoflavus]|uniref:HNH endonuclease n=1 Tax=Streptomyces albidoflavus TaxID=1886 RepID=UPI00332371F6
MGKGICSINECTGTAVARGWCDKHYRRWKKSGDPTATSRIVGDDVARFWSHATRGEPDRCWPWTGSVNVPPRGTPYGTFFYDGRTRAAHVVSFLLANGPTSIPPRHVVDHLCSNTLCVNPAHLQSVTQRENVHRGKLLKITDERIRELAILHSQGVPIAQLARDEGVTARCIHLRFKRLAKEEAHALPDAAR